MNSTKQQGNNWLSLSYWVFVGLLAYMPLHIFVSTWLGTSFGILEQARIVKDVVMVIGFAVALTLSVKKPWFRGLLKDRLVILIIAYGALTLLIAIIKDTDKDAEILGFVYNTRFLVFFLYAILLAKLSNVRKLTKDSLLAVFGSALIVLVFGLLQYTVMPNNFLENFGYKRSNGVLPAFFIDEKPDLERIMSTVRDPNSYGSYLIIIGSMALALLLKKKAYRNIALGFSALTILNLIFTFSRSAWIGFFISIIFLLAISMTKKLSKKQMKTGIIAGISVALLASVVLAASWNSYFVQNVIFHADQNTVLEDPNELRIRFFKESISDIAADPIGSGPGTAGLASIRNNVQGTELNENYYLQIASEVGIGGLLLFISILIMVGLRLFRLAPSNWIALALFASFMGIAFTNLLVHIWSNEAVAYTWWGMVGIVLIWNRAGNTDNKKSLKN
jgi:hypothetical protein